MADDEDETDRVGYRRPPKHTQFKPGQSGNRKGRPPKHKRGAVDVAALLDEAIAVRKDGVTRTMSGFEASVRKLVSRAVKDGDLQAALEFLRLCETYGVIEPPPAPPESGGVLVIPRRWDRDEWRKMFETHDPPAWLGPRLGMPESE